MCTYMCSYFQDNRRQKMCPLQELHLAEGYGDEDSKSELSCCMFLVLQLRKKTATRRGVRGAGG